MAGPFKARRIVETEVYQQSQKRIHSSAKRMDEVLFALTTALSENPEEGQRVYPDRSLYIRKTEGFKSAPVLRVWYTFDDETVTLLLMEKRQDDEPE
jgi:hypothetical protein